MRLTYVASLAVVLAACGGSGTAPSAPPKLADASRTANELQAIAAPGTTNALTDFTLLSLQFVATITGHPLQVFVPAAPAGSRAARSARAAFMVLEALVGRPVAPRAPREPPPAGVAAASTLFPDTLLGKTFAWDTAAHGYVASSATGAPANGVRFLLYQVNPLSATPAMPLDPIGYVDLTDQGTASTKLLGIAIVGTVGTSVTYASYTISVPASGPASDLALSGFLTDGFNRLDLNATLTASLNGLTLHTALSVASLGASVDETVTLTLSGSTETIDVDFTLTSDGEAVREAGALTIDTTALTIGGNLAVTVNGRAFATIVVNSQRLTYNGANGVQLTPQDEAALDTLYATSAEVFGTVLLLTLPGVVLLA